MLYIKCTKMQQSNLPIMFYFSPKQLSLFDKVYFRHIISAAARFPQYMLNALRKMHFRSDRDFPLNVSISFIAYRFQAQTRIKLCFTPFVNDRHMKKENIVQYSSTVFTKIVSLNSIFLRQKRNIYL